MSDLFAKAGLGFDSQQATDDQGPAGPLADQLRPKHVADVVGQDHLLGPEGTLTRLIAAGHLPSLIFWGPPGTGKTTIARLLAQDTGHQFQQISAVFSGVADLKKAFEAAKTRRRAGQRTLLFVDEIHRFNRAQQDGFLPYVEDGTITLLGATTENPSFALNGALLSRAQVMVLKRLDEVALETLLQRAEATCERQLPLTAEARAHLIHMADGDGRYLLGLAEDLLRGPDTPERLDVQGLGRRLQTRAPAYDRNREEHYNLISALHKSVRGSDPDAALYWMARMLEGGEDPLYLARRLVRMAVEDIGLADPGALRAAMAAKDCYEFLGAPEGELALMQVAVHLAAAPKSNAVYVADKRARKLAKQTGSLMPPAHILNAPTKMMKTLGYGDGYEYDHDVEGGVSGQNYFPDGVARPTLYEPKDAGFEARLAERLQEIARIRAERAGD